MFFRILLFLGIFVCSLMSIWQNKDKLNIDIFSLLGVDLGYYEAQVIKNLNSQNTFSILFKNLEDKDKILALAKDSSLFLDSKTQDFDINKLSHFSLALADKNAVSLLQKDENLFFQKSIKNLFSSFIGILSGDFFGLMNNANFNIFGKFDPQSGLVKTQNFYLLNYDLKQNYDSNELLNFTTTLKQNSDVYVNSPSLYAAYGKQTAMKESLYFGSISLVLSIILVLLAFKNLHIFSMIFIVIFSLIFSLGATILVLPSVNLLTLVISTSLIGLILDYPIHFLSTNVKTKIVPKNIVNIKTTLLGAFLITSLGYLLFLLSSMQFLHEIAIFSIFALVAALLSTYFLFPYLVENRIFSSSFIFDSFVDSYMRICGFIKKRIKIFFVFVIMFAIFGAFKIQNLNLRDNIKNYSSAPQSFIDDSAIFAKELDSSIKPRFIVINADKSRQIVERLKSQNLIENEFFISSIINDKTTQDRLRDIFKAKANDKELIKKYENFGIDREFLKNEFSKIINQEPATNENICKAFLQEKCKYFFIDNNEIIYIDKVKEDSNFRAILAEFEASYSDYISTLNNNFDNIKINAILLKLVGFIVAFIILALFLGYKIGLKIVSCIIFVSFLSGLIFIIFDLGLDIFAIFGFILGSAVGIDYMLFAYSKTLLLKQKILGILGASLTSMASFVTLTFSSTAAVFNFGFSVTIFIAIASFVASILALGSEK